MINCNKKKSAIIKLLLFIGIILSFMCINTVTYATIRGDADSDDTVTAYDAYCVLTESINDPPSGGYPESTIQLIDMDCDTEITSYDAYKILKKSIEDLPTNYIMPEDYGAVGDGVTDDTDAFEICMNSNVPNVVLTGDYVINGPLSTTKEKHFYNGKIITKGSGTFRALTFRNTVSFKDTIFTSDRDEQGAEVHGATFQHTSNTFFVEVWDDDNSFEGCVFHNAITAIRGRISTGQGAEYVPQNLYVNNCRFTECKMPIQGLFAYTNVNNSSFRNNGDVYHGEHCVYIDTLGSKELNVRGCLIETYDSDSGAAIQIHGKSNAGNITTPPTINVENCRIYANGVVSSDFANVIATNVYFDSQFVKHDTEYDRDAFTITGGALHIESGYYNHLSFISKATFDAGVNSELNNVTCRIKKEVYNWRCYYPYNANNCTFINWGGSVLAANTTRLYGCIFTRDYPFVVGKYYIEVAASASAYIENSAFKSGDYDYIAGNSSGYLELKNCHYVNGFRSDATNYVEIGTIHEDIVD